MNAPKHILLLALLCACAGAGAEASRCTVCGMRPAEYPRWRASAELADGSTVEFESPKCFFRFLKQPGRYKPGARVARDARLRVVEYYSQRPADPRSLHFVTRSDVLGPMGPDYVPIRGLAEARQFLADHQGREILTFDQAVRSPP